MWLWKACFCPTLVVGYSLERATDLWSALPIYSMGKCPQLYWKQIFIKRTLLMIQARRNAVAELWGNISLSRKVFIFFYVELENSFFPNNKNKYICWKFLPGPFEAWAFFLHTYIHWRLLQRYKKTDLKKRRRKKCLWSIHSYNTPHPGTPSPSR